MTTYIFAPYDVLQVRSVETGQWVDYLTLRTETDARSAVELVDKGTWARRGSDYQIVRLGPQGGVVHAHAGNERIDITMPHHMGAPGLSIAEEAVAVAQASIVTGKVVPGTEKKVPKPKKESRTAKWSRLVSDAASALAQLRELQEEFENWRDNLPENLQSSALGEKLDTVCDLDIEGAISTIDDASSAELPLGFGRD